MNPDEYFLKNVFCSHSVGNPTENKSKQLGTKTLPDIFKVHLLNYCTVVILLLFYPGNGNAENSCFARFILAEVLCS